MTYLDALNNAQRQAALTIEGPLLILAGAGAGKTRTIVYRILHLIKEGVAPESILAVTFTNKAAKEMRERIEECIRADRELNLPLSHANMPFVATFHALGVTILRAHAKAVGLPRHFTIYTRDDSVRAIKEAMRSVGVDPQQFEPRKVLSVISTQKGKAISLSPYQEQAGNEYFPRLVAEVWEAYELLLKKGKALDFDDLLLKTLVLLQTNKEILEQYQKTWTYLHIDEYQDTNTVQYLLMRLLAQPENNVCVVGDIDQNIYSWRGATIDNILNFEKEYPDAKTIYLEQNCRSTKIIVAASNEIIRKNTNRKEKNLFTDNVEGEKITLYSAYDESDEARFVVRKAQELITSGIEPRGIAVLYRTNFQSRILEELFLTENVPYQVLGVRFFERKEVRDILSFIRAALNPESVSDIKRIINVPPRGIGKVTLLKIITGKKAELTQTMRARVDNFMTLLARIREHALSEKPSKTVRFIMRETGIEEQFAKGSDDDLDRLENSKELVTLATRYDNLPGEEAIEKLLEDAALATDQDELRENKNAVRLMTVHAAKGLEFDYVFITGLEGGLFPHENIGGAQTGRDEEEERRLFYVALTRARTKIFLLYASVRTIFGSQQVNVPSEFITDFDERFLEEDYSQAHIKTVYLD